MKAHPLSLASQNCPMTSDPQDDRRTGQFALRHLLGLVTLAAVPLALLAPIVRSLDADTQRKALLSALLVFIVVPVMAGMMIRSRRKVEMLAGPLLLRCERRSSRVLKWVFAVILVCGYLATALVQPIGRAPWYAFPGNPWLLYMAVGYFVMRIWWNLDPKAIEACENGLIQGGFNFIPWSKVQRYTWSGQAANQLNLYYKHAVGSVKVDRPYVDQLEPILAVKIAAANQPHAPQPVEAQTPA